MYQKSGNELPDEMKLSAPHVKYGVNTSTQTTPALAPRPTRHSDTDFGDPQSKGMITTEAVNTRVTNVNGVTVNHIRQEVSASMAVRNKVDQNLVIDKYPEEVPSSEFAVTSMHINSEEVYEPYDIGTFNTADDIEMPVIQTPKTSFATVDYTVKSTDEAGISRTTNVSKPWTAYDYGQHYIANYNKGPLTTLTPQPDPNEVFQNTLRNLWLKGSGNDVNAVVPFTEDSWQAVRQSMLTFTNHIREDPTPPVRASSIKSNNCIPLDFELQYTKEKILSGRIPNGVAFDLVMNTILSTSEAVARSKLPTLHPVFDTKTRTSTTARNVIFGLPDGVPSAKLYEIKSIDGAWQVIFRDNNYGTATLPWSKSNFNTGPFTTIFLQPYVAVRSTTFGLFQVFPTSGTSDSYYVCTSLDIGTMPNSIEVYDAVVINLTLPTGTMEQVSNFTLQWDHFVPTTTLSPGAKLYLLDRRPVLW